MKMLKIGGCQKRDFFPPRTALLLLLAMLLAFGGCAKSRHPDYSGFSVLQTEKATLDSGKFARSLTELTETGANAVAFIPFLEQDNERDVRVRISKAVTDQQLIVAIRLAKKAGLKTVLKPQVLVPDSWQGAINPGSASGWDAWFGNYADAISHYAAIAEKEHVDLFVIGTELNESAAQPHWRPLIERARGIFRGSITYAAHNVEGIEQFRHWDLLDTVGATLYPSLCAKADLREIKNSIAVTVEKLLQTAAPYKKPLWILEVGIPSIKGAQQKPWQWRHPDKSLLIADTGLQATVIDLWLDALDTPKIEGALIWCWYSDPEAGGLENTDYTVQNKISQRVLQYRWTR